MEDDEYEFHLKVMPKSDRALPFDILASKEEETILVCWSWALYEEDRKAIRMIDSKIKERFASEVKFGFNLMNLPIIFYKSPEDLQVMHTQKVIKLDQLTKEILLNVFSELIQALEFTSRKFIDHFSMPVEFDPSSHV
ncbi:hypothetical protein BH18THE1_BH18THE1_19370 [soil metagenome]